MPQPLSNSRQHTVDVVVHGPDPKDYPEDILEDDLAFMETEESNKADHLRTANFRLVRRVYGEYQSGGERVEGLGLARQSREDESRTSPDDDYEDQSIAAAKGHKIEEN
ncbi:MAG: hypothetical protein M1827_001097 [Pycnora praestabilis]|nr:MAG: hypothetical protein M1827_001097 [Pycnora praestabilis]